MKKTFAIVLSLVLCIGILAACGTNDSTPTTAPTADTTEPAATEPAATELSGNVNVNGSTSMGDVIAALTEGFNEANPDVTINYTGSGSGAGITGVLDGTCDLGLSSRALTDDEKSQGAVENVIAKDVGDDKAAAMLELVPQDNDVTIDGMDKSMSDSTAYVTADLPEGGQMKYKVSLVRDMMGWKVANVDYYASSQY